jgi:hypothetical protein
MKCCTSPVFNLGGKMKKKKVKAVKKNKKAQLRVKNKKKRR